MMFRASAFVVAGLLCLGVTSTPAAAQQVLVCQTLHNDLVNFERRAFTADRYQAEIDQLRRDNESSEGLTAAFCTVGVQFFGTCDQQDAVRQVHDQTVNQLIEIHRQSRLGGSDPIRLRIIAEMRRNGCLGPTNYTADGARIIAVRRPRPVVIDPLHVVRVKD